MREETARGLGEVAVTVGTHRASVKGHVVVAARLKKFRLRVRARRRSSLRQQRAEGGGQVSVA